MSRNKSIKQNHHCKGQRLHTGLAEIRESWCMYRRCIWGNPHGGDVCELLPVFQAQLARGTVGTDLSHVHRHGWAFAYKRVDKSKCMPLQDRRRRRRRTSSSSSSTTTTTAAMGGHLPHKRVDKSTCMVLQDSNKQNNSHESYHALENTFCLCRTILMSHVHRQGRAFA